MADPGDGVEATETWVKQVATPLNELRCRLEGLTRKVGGCWGEAGLSEARGCVGFGRGMNEWDLVYERTEFRTTAKWRGRTGQVSARGGYR